MLVEIQRIGNSRIAVPRARLKKRATAMLLGMGLGDAELSIVLCDDPTIHDLNRSYRDKDRATDVLAFAMREGEVGAVNDAMLGDVIISLDTAGRQATTRHHSLFDEVTFLLAHGLLHLLGFDHATRSEERRMSARTDMLVCAARTSDRKSQRLTRG